MADTAYWYRVEGENGVTFVRISPALLVGDLKKEIQKENLDLKVRLMRIKIAEDAQELEDDVVIQDIDGIGNNGRDKPLIVAHPARAAVASGFEQVMTWSSADQFSRCDIGCRVVVLGILLVTGPCLVAVSLCSPNLDSQMPTFVEGLIVASASVVMDLVPLLCFAQEMQTEKINTIKYVVEIFIACLCFLLAGGAYLKVQQYPTNKGVLENVSPGFIVAAGLSIAKLVAIHAVCENQSVQNTVGQWFRKQLAACCGFKTGVQQVRRVAPVNGEGAGGEEHPHLP